MVAIINSQPGKSAILRSSYEQVTRVSVGSAAGHNQSLRMKHSQPGESVAEYSGAAMDIAKDV
jgi:hypothetical protein